MKKVFKKVRIALALALIVVMSLSMTVFAEGEANEAAQAAKDAIFQVEVVYKDPATGSSFVLQTGTGFLIGAEATSGEYMITCDHVARLSDKDLAWYKDYFGVDQGSQLDTSIQIIVKGSVSVGATVVNESSAGDMDFAILKLDQPISERKTLLRRWHPKSHKSTAPLWSPDNRRSYNILSGFVWPYPYFFPNTSSIMPYSLASAATIQ